MPPLDGSDVGSQVARVLDYVRRHPVALLPLQPPMSDMLQTMAARCPYKLLRPVLWYASSWPLSR